MLNDIGLQGSYPFLMLNDIGLQGSYPFLNKKIQGLSRTHFPFFMDSIQCQNEP